MTEAEIGYFVCLTCHEHAALGDYGCLGAAQIAHSAREHRKEKPTHDVRVGGETMAMIRIGELEAE